MEINVWTSSNVKHIHRDKVTGSYKVIVQRKGEERVFVVTHVIIATGFASGGMVHMPTYPGMVSS